MSMCRISSSSEEVLKRWFDTFSSRTEPVPRLQTDIHVITSVITSVIRRRTEPAVERVC